ncbi:hypothetical protein PHYSODRAFT_495757 [Phytophthora sojae]|uniref:Uncharacterized protein n=1 Tax=Phytophthora sojae (strain P6497) TaxID=1094619 RepID=G4Z4Q6_PHYSP|nr:hypothetical protein PHYSODRAFT_495757 [Phytophthora sojae]EGZ21593.1 hypothetical protein PHYSODRAFT_495757 [Phytophthora sojae]|eukprot:XP_009524310.1 hypothetical protein PHYSODRAFT_495757 [Phytophthora sojae]
MLELVKFRHIRINDQLLHKLILERAELQQLFYNRFRQADAAHTTSKSSNRKSGKAVSVPGNNRRETVQQSPKGSIQATLHAGGSDVARPQQGSRPKGRPPPRTGCLHCKGEHWLRDCPVATPDEKKAAREAHQSKNWKVKRAYTVLINGAVEISMCPDTGADKCILPADAVIHCQ